MIKLIDVLKIFYCLPYNVFEVFKNLSENDTHIENTTNENLNL